MPSILTLLFLCGCFNDVFTYAQSSSNLPKLTGKPSGKKEVHDGVEMYISEPTCPTKADTAILYLTDAFGLPLVENKLLVDSFAQAGYLTVAPDFLNGDPAPHDIDFNSTAWLNRHNVSVSDPPIDTTIKYMRKSLGVKRIAVTGYCFGGRYAFRFLEKGRGADVGFMAHPSYVKNHEILSIDGAVSVAAAESDPLLKPTRRLKIENLLGRTKLPFQTTLDSGTVHGFGTRINISDPQQRFAKVEAFFQALRWFDAW